MILALKEHLKSDIMSFDKTKLHQKGALIYMIHENQLFEQTKKSFHDAFAKLKISHLLRQSGVLKLKGIPAMSVFKFLVLLVFQGKNLYRFLNSKHNCYHWSHVMPPNVKTFF